MMNVAELIQELRNYSGSVYLYTGGGEDEDD